MSARTEVRSVIQTLIVKTMRVPMIVHAEMDSLAMARSVMVSTSSTSTILHSVYNGIAAIYNTCSGNSSNNFYIIISLR